MALRGLILDIIKLTKTHGNESGLFNVIIFWGIHRCVLTVWFNLAKIVKVYNPARTNALEYLYMSVYELWLLPVRQRKMNKTEKTNKTSGLSWKSCFEPLSLLYCCRRQRREINKSELIKANH